MVGVTEYGEGMDVKLGYDKGRPVIVASNEAGYNATFVDLIQVLEWVDENMPEFKRKWVGLTQTQVKLLREGVHEESIKTGDSIDWVFYTHINEALKEKNT